jgi:alpha-galactosidase
LTAETAVSPTLQLTQDIQPVYVTVWVSDSKTNISSTAGFRLVQLENKLWVNYVMNLYDIIDQLRAKYPNLEIESCSGGGGRIDLGILKRVEQAWTSDNTFDRLTLQDGFTHTYAPKVMMDLVTDVPNTNGRVPRSSSAF